jgi:MFS superfamily sulfate permease-like transporter
MSKTKPLDGLAGLRQNFISDLTAGFIVFLIALPLSIGIALASGMPALSGLIAAAVGGMVVSLLSGSYLTINGPAAGLIAVVASAIEMLGQGDAARGVTYTLAAIVVAGLFLIVAGWFKMGRFAAFFPGSAIHGMLAAIGIIIVSKQIHILLGKSPKSKEPLELLMEIPHSLQTANLPVALVGLLSLVLLILLSYSKNSFVKALPKPLVVVVFGAVLADYLGFASSNSLNWFGQDYQLGAEYLVNLPKDLSSSLIRPDFSVLWSNPTGFAVVVFVIAIITGLESLISLSAVDQLDPYGRESNPNRDLMAVGFGTSLSGLLGGFPLIAEIVRSSANISNGAKTRWSNFFHGLFIVIAVLVFPGLIRLMPLSALAAVLCFVGYRLAAPKELIHVYRIHRLQAFVFVLTVLVVLATDLLLGMVVGILAELSVNYFFYPHFKCHFRAGFKSENNLIETGNVVGFSNVIAYKKLFETLPAKSQVNIDFAHTNFIDHSAMAQLISFKMRYNLSGGDLHFSNMEHLKPLSHHPLAPRSHEAALTDISLTRRQQNLSALAETLDFSFSLKSELPDRELSRCHFFKGKLLKYKENIICGLFGEHEVEIFDLAYAKSEVIYSQGLDFTTVILIKHIEKKIPYFVLQEETTIDFLGDLLGFKDIDFKDFPEFSKRYLLWGKDSLSIRHLFSKELLEFIMVNDTFFVQSLNHGLLIHQNYEALSALQTRKAIEFAKVFHEILLKNLEKRKSNLKLN